MINEEPTEKQIEVLFRIAPGPIGQGMKIKEAAKDLGVTIQAIKQRLDCFKKNFPKAWNNFKRLRELARQDRYKLRWKRHPKQKVGLKLFSELE